MQYLMLFGEKCKFTQKIFYWNSHVRRDCNHSHDLSLTNKRDEILGRDRIWTPLTWNGEQGRLP